MSDNASLHLSRPGASAAVDNPFLNGLWKQNPVFVQVWGCARRLRSPTAFATRSPWVSPYFRPRLLERAHLDGPQVVPKQVRIATYIAIIATS
jgi:hypothetical protein